MYIGIDIHKRYAQVAVMNEIGQIIEEARVENANLDEFAQRHAGAKAAIEATGNYYHIHDTLSEYLDVVVANPSKLKTIAQSDKKTDRVDAKQLARLVRLDSIPESYVPTEQIRECRALVRGRESLVQNRTEYANKVHALLSDHGVTRNVKPLSASGRESLRELSLPETAQALLESHLRVIETLTDEITQLDERIEQRAESLPETQLLVSIPGISYYSALTIYAELGEISRFDGDKEVVSYVGLNPKGSSRARWVLVQAARVAVHTCEDEYLSRFYHRLAGRKNDQKAIVATARKLLVSIYYMLERGQEYDPPGVSS